METSLLVPIPVLTLICLSPVLFGMWIYTKYKQDQWWMKWIAEVEINHLKRMVANATTQYQLQANGTFIDIDALQTDPKTFDLHISVDGDPVNIRLSVEGNQLVMNHTTEDSPIDVVLANIEPPDALYAALASNEPLDAV